MGWLATVSKFFKWINFGLSSPPIWQTFEKSNQNFIKEQKPNDPLKSADKKISPQILSVWKKSFFRVLKKFLKIVLSLSGN